MLMKVAYVLTTFPSRSETFALGEIDALGRLGFEVVVLAAQGVRNTVEHGYPAQVCYRPALFSQQAAASIIYFLCKYPAGVWRLLVLMLVVLFASWREAAVILANFYTIACFARRLDEEGIEHVHGYFMNWPACMALALATATGRTYSLAGHARDIFVEDRALALKVARSDFVVMCTREGLEHMCDNIPESLHDKVHLVRHGVEIHETLESQAPVDLPKECQKTVMAIGRFVEKKGFKYLLKAFALVRHQHGSCTLVLAGDGPQRDDLSALVERLGIGEHVCFAGWQEHAALMGQLSRASILVAPSVVASDGDRDGVPNVILEALALGVSVIACEAGAIGEVIIDGQTGVLTPAGDVGKLAQAITLLLEDTELQKRLAQNGHRLVADKFDRARNTQALADLFWGVRG